MGTKTQSGDITPDDDHWGQSGYQISDTDGVIDGQSYVSLQGETRSGLYQESEDAIASQFFSTAAGAKNLVLLMIGTNDFLHQVVNATYGVDGGDVGDDAMGEAQDKIAEGCAERLTALLAAMNGYAATLGLHLTVLLATVPDIDISWTGDAVSTTLIAEVTELNTMIRTTIGSAQYSNVTVVVVNQNAATTGKLEDGVHPSQAGYDAMAVAWMAAITPLIADVPM